MSFPQLNKISIIGTGKVATHLSKALYKAGYDIHQVYGRDENKVKNLAVLCEAMPISSLSTLDHEADIYIVCIADDAVGSVISQINVNDKLIVHTSGSLPIEIFAGNKTNYGVFYPLQTFSAHKELDFKKIPICVEANSPQNEKLLDLLAASISDNVHVVDSDKRLVLHTSAVFACNFSNHLYTIAEDLLKEHELDFNLLRPLIDETASKVMDDSPQNAQTGPALRRDRKTIDKHLKLLEQTPEYRDLYKQLSELIMKKYNT